MILSVTMPGNNRQEGNVSTHYDAIHEPFDCFKETAIDLIGKEDVRMQVEPLVRGKRVLEFACGSGGYTFDLMQWGAASVFNVDLSPAMFDAAKEMAHRLMNAGTIPDNWDSLLKNIKFQIGDCRQAVKYGDGPHDVVFAAWLLNYAATTEEMTTMMDTVSLNLRDGGVSTQLHRSTIHDRAPQPCATAAKVGSGELC